MLSLLLACTGPDKPDPDVPAATPCTTGSWGDVDEAEAAAAVHVRAEGSDDGDGSEAAPFATFAAAMVDAPTRVLVGPGTFDALRVESDAEVTGCGAESVIATDGPGVRIDGGTVTVSGFRVEGANPGVWTWQGADVALSSLSVEDATGPGVVLEGAVTHATLDTIEVEGAGGYGLAIQDATVEGGDVTITGATDLGVLVDGLDAVVTLDGLAVSALVAGTSGEARGVQVQHFSAATLANVTISDAIGAGVVGLQAVTLSLENVRIENTTAGSGYGDGLVMLHGTADEDYDQPYFELTTAGLTVSGAARAGVLLSGNGLLGRLLSATISADYDPGSGMPLTQGGPALSNDTVPTYDLDATGESLPIDADPAPLVYVDP